MSISEVVGFGVFVAVYGYIIAKYIPGQRYILTNLLTAGGSLLYAAAVGASWADLGLVTSQLPKGLLFGLLVSLPIIAVIMGVASLPPLRGLFSDGPSKHSSRRTTWFELTVRIPFGTALSEEVLFRSVLLGLLLASTSTLWAIIISAVLFGLWHVVPTLETLSRNDSFSELIDEQKHHRVISLLATIGATMLAGAGFAGLRLWTGSVATPWVVHTCINGVAVLSGWLVLKMNGK